MPTTPAHQLEHWIAQEEDVRRRMSAGRGPGVAAFDEVASRSGLYLLQGVLHGEIPSAPLTQALDIVLIEVSKGYAVFQGTPGAQHLSSLGTVHGGWIAALLDAALGGAIQSLLPAGRAHSTVELSVNIVRALTPKVAKVRAEGRIIHCGRQLASADARLHGPDGTLYAHAKSTCLVYDLPPQTTA